LYYSQDFIRLGIKCGTFVQKVQEEIVNEFVNDSTSVVTKLNIHAAS
jgi:hypothetical protein